MSRPGVLAISKTGTTTPHSRAVQMLFCWSMKKGFALTILYLGRFSGKAIQKTIKEKTNKLV